MGYMGRVSAINENTAVIVLIAENIVTGWLNIPTHIIGLAVNDLVMCLFTSSTFNQGVIIAKME